MATLDNFGFKARKSRTLTKVIPSKLIEHSSSSFIAPVDIKPVTTTTTTTTVAHKRKHSIITKSQQQQQQTSIKTYFNKEEIIEEEEEPIITCIIKNHITTSEIWKILENEYTTLIPAPKMITSVNKRRVTESNKRTSPLKRQRTMDSLSEFMDRYLKVTEDTSFETIKEQEEEEYDEVLIRPIKKFTAAESKLLICQLAQEFIIPF